MNNHFQKPQNIWNSKEKTFTSPSLISCNSIRISLIIARISAMRFDQIILCVYISCKNVWKTEIKLKFFHIGLKKSEKERKIFGDEIEIASHTCCED